MPQTPVYALPYPAETDTADVPRDIQALATRVEAVLPNASFPTGMGADWYAAVAPTGFLLCDGSAVSRTTFARLFAVIGTTWGGGDGSTTFNLPDCRGRVIVGVFGGGQGEVNTLGGNDGTPAGSRRVRHAHTIGLGAVHNLTLPAHGHAVGDPTHYHQGYDYNSNTDGSNHKAVNNAGTQSGVSASVETAPAATGVWVGDPTSYPTINGGVSVTGTVGVTGGTADGPSFVVANKAIKT